MKKYLTLLLVVILNSFLLCQVELKGTMGINFLSTPSLQDYINQIYAPSSAQLGSFNSAIIFTGEAGKFLSKEIELSVEIPYQIYSYTENTLNGQYELSYNLFLPSAMAYYVIAGESYNFKLGFGAGLRLVAVTESKKWEGSERDLSSTGFGSLLRVEGNTLLAENLYANIGLDIRYDVNGEPEDNDGSKLRNTVQGEDVNFDTFSVGVKLGISYLIGGTD